MESDRTIKWWQPQIGSIERDYINDVLDSNYPNEGKYTTLFENKICDLLGCKHAVAVTNGTSALFISLKSLGIGKGDDVLVPNLTFIATANAVSLCGARPIFVDIDPNTLTISPESISDSITDDTKAVIPVHVSGRSCDMSPILRIANEYDISVVEDAAEGFMSKHNEEYLGRFGIMGCFSFSPNKLVSSGQGGVVVTDDDNLYIYLKELKDQGRPTRGTGGDDIHNSIGYNFKFTDLQAALGLGQLSYLQERMKRTRKIYELYSKNLNSDNISLFGFKNGELPLWTDAFSDKRNELIEYLKTKNIECRKLWHPITTQEPYLQTDCSKFPNSMRMSKKSFWLPSAFTLTDDDIIGVCDYINEF